MKGLSLSGGSTKIPALAGAAITLIEEKGYFPDVITGISAGAILAVPLAMGLHEEIKKFTTSFTLSDIFDIKPVTKKGKISLRGLWRAIIGKQSFGSQDNLIETLSCVIDQHTFELYKNGDYPICYLGSVEYKTGRRVYINVKEVEYLEYLQWVLASSSIPVFVESVKIRGEYFYDGGVRDHIGSHWLMENFELSDHVSIYSRPSDYNIKEPDWKPENIPTVLFRTLDILSVEVSKNDESREDDLAIHKGINNKKIFMPYTLSTEAYKTDPKLLKEWYNIGVSATRNQF